MCACLIVLIGISGAQAQESTSRSASAAQNTVDAFKTVRKSPTSFTWTYTNKRPAGSQPVNGETIQITSGNPAILQSVTFDGVTGMATGSQSAFSFYPLDIAAGATVTGTGTTSAPLANGTTLKYYVTTDAFATQANTTSVDSTLTNVALLKPAGKLYLNSAKGFVEEAIKEEDEAANEKPADAHQIAVKASVARAFLEVAESRLHEATGYGAIDKTTDEAITGLINPAMNDDRDADAAADKNDVTLAKHLLAKARGNKEAALRLIEAASKP